MVKPQESRPEIWGGIECTINRLNDIFIDQIELTGHSQRITDLDLFADLGIKKIRYPVLWERIYDNNTHSYNWSWTDERLNRLKELNIQPIVGLVHHGSGPFFTNLLDDNFPDLLSEFASKVVERYPWVEYYNPVNEPLTTARFSCLYGHWYPHLRDDFSFSKAVLNRCKAIILSMKEIQKVNPDAKLVQTEDMGNASSSKNLKYQADFENIRRWLTFDLLCGKVNGSHPMWEFFTKAGIQENTLEFFINNNFAPHIIGLNYYLTSERFLDGNYKKYPGYMHGSNKYQKYVDIEAVRVYGSGYIGLYKLLKLVWDRYNIPIAITEAHLTCTREEQLRWFNEIYQICSLLCRENVPVKAVTAWSLLGSFDWNSLLTRIEGKYEPGVYDIRSNKPRATELTNLIKHLVKNEVYNYPLIKSPGWWKRDIRILYSVKKRIFDEGKFEDDEIQPIIIINGSGTLGHSFAKICNRRGLKNILLDRNEIDLTKNENIEFCFKKLQPWAVINTAGYNDIEKAELYPHLCRIENINSAANLAEVSSELGIRFLTFSTDLVFSGNRSHPYYESSSVAPINVFGVSKAAAEELILQKNPSALIIRTSACFSIHDEHNYISLMLQQITEKKKVYAANDIIISPTYTPELINTSLDILIDREAGIWHLANNGSVTWAGFLQKIVEASGYDCKYIIPQEYQKLNYIAKRPLYSVLGSERASLMSSLDEAINHFRWNR